jgi:hypothetical protein
MCSSANCYGGEQHCCKRPNKAKRTRNAGDQEVHPWFEDLRSAAVATDRCRPRKVIVGSFIDWSRWQSKQGGHLVETPITLGVYRRLDNRFLNLPDDSPLAVELHVRRQVALHAVFDSEESIRVLDWGDTDDVKPHEYVELSILGYAVIHYALVPGLEWLGKKLAEKAVDSTLSALIKKIVSVVRGKQESKEILDIVVKLPNGTEIHVDPPDRGATISIAVPGGPSITINYKTSEESKSG